MGLWLVLKHTWNEKMNQNFKLKQFVGAKQGYSPLLLDDPSRTKRLLVSCLSESRSKTKQHNYEFCSTRQMRSLLGELAKPPTPSRLVFSVQKWWYTERLMRMYKKFILCPSLYSFVIVSRKIPVCKQKGRILPWEFAKRHDRICL